MGVILLCLGKERLIIPFVSVVLKRIATTPSMVLFGPGSRL
jgi:hypothetical protein